MKGKDKTHQYNTRSKKVHQDKKYKHKRNESSDDSGSDSEEELNMQDYQNLLARIFPSKYMQSKSKRSSKSSKYDDPKETIKTLKMIRGFYQKENNKHMVKDCDFAIKEMQSVGKTQNMVNDYDLAIKELQNKKKKYSKKNESDNESDTSEEEDDDEDTSEDANDDDDSDESAGGEDNSDEESGSGDSESEDECASDEYESDEEEDEIVIESGGNKFNIIFTMGNTDNEDQYDAEDEEESEDDVETDSEDDSEVEGKTEKSNSKNQQLLNDNEILHKFQTMAKELLKKDKKSKVLRNINSNIKDIDRKINKNKYKKERKLRTKNTDSFKKLLSNKNSLNDIKFFEKKLSIVEQEKMLTEMTAVNKHTTIDKPYRLKLLESKIPASFKGMALKKVASLRYMDHGSGEYHKMKTWVDNFMRIPFGIYRSIPVTMEDGQDKCTEFMSNAKDTLDACVYGMNDAKLQILQLAGQWITNPGAIGTAVGIYGPPGTGKTTLVKDGFSKILGRDFAFIALGGTSDAAGLEGHSYTYEGAIWGKIVEILMQCKSMNPIIYFDELDKISNTPKGEEIIGILTHLTDTTQNSQFHDKYFAELDFDLSKCLFIFSYNDEHKVNNMYSVLRDRMYRIETKGYKTKEKITIANDYLLPKIREQVKFEKGNIILEDTVLEHIIEKYTEKEEGVRNLKRCLEIIHTKLNLYRLIKPESCLFGEEKTIEVAFPMTVTVEIVDKLIKTNDKNSGPPMGMYV